MGEMAQALKALRNIKAAYLGKNPAGTWSFVGMVDARLIYIKEDGSFPSEEELKAIRNFGFVAAKNRGIKTRVFHTQEDAEKEAQRIGQAYKI